MQQNTQMDQSPAGKAATEAYNAGWDTAAAQLGNPDAKHSRPISGYLAGYYTKGYNDCIAYYQSRKGNGNTYER